MFLSASCSNNEKPKNIAQETSNSHNNEKNTENRVKDMEHRINIGKEDFDLDSMIRIQKLEGLDDEELSLLRNAIYAKNGYRFTSSKYSEYFEEIEWYKPKFNDVNDMLTDIDIQNIEKIVEIEKPREMSHTPSKVFEISRDVENKSYTYKVKFFLQEDLKARHDQTFSQFKIYRIDDDNTTMILDCKDISDVYEYGIISTASETDDILKIEDKDNDKIEEIYFTLEDILGHRTILVVENINDKYVTSFYGYEFEELEYKDIDEDGIMELINDHPGGGGYVSTWIGLNLVNELQGERYNFSYNLTRLYYEKIKNEYEAVFERSPTPESFVKLLNAYADLGISKKCNDLIDKYPELVNNKEFDYSEYYDGPAETFFGYVVYRARAYNSTWKEMKKWDSESKDQKNSKTSSLDTDTIEVTDGAPQIYDVVKMGFLPQQYIDFMKEKDSEHNIAFYAKEDTDLDGNDEVIVASGTMKEYAAESYIDHLYILRESDGKIEQLGDNLAEGGYSVYNVKLIRIQDMPQKYIYCGIGNGAGLLGFKIYGLSNNELNTIGYSASATGSGVDELKDFDSDGEYDGYVQNRSSYDALYYSLSNTYVLDNNDFILDHSYVEIPEYPENIKDLLMQYLSLRVLNVFNEGKSPEVDKRLSELCIYDKAKNIKISSDVWYYPLYNEMMFMNNTVKFDIEESNNATTTKVSYVDDNEKEHTYTFHLIKLEDKWCIDKIINL